MAYKLYHNKDVLKNISSSPALSFSEKVDVFALSCALVLYNEASETGKPAMDLRSPLLSNLMGQRGLVTIEHQHGCVWTQQTQMWLLL